MNTKGPSLDKNSATTGWIIAGVVFGVVVTILVILYLIKRRADQDVAKIYPYEEKPVV